MDTKEHVSRVVRLGEKFMQGPGRKEKKVAPKRLSSARTAQLKRSCAWQGETKTRRAVAEYEISMAGCGDNCITDLQMSRTPDTLPTLH